MFISQYPRSSFCTRKGFQPFCKLRMKSKHSFVFLVILMMTSLRQGPQEKRRAALGSFTGKHQLDLCYVHLVCKVNGH
jgi:hypothetical protein